MSGTVAPLRHSRTVVLSAPLSPAETPERAEPGAGKNHGGLLLCFHTCLSSSAGSVFLSGIRVNSLAELVPGLWFPGLWVRLVPTKKAVIVETSIQRPPPPNSA